METILLKHLLCMMCVIGVVTLIACLFWLWREFFRTWREKKAKQKEGCQQQKKNYMPAGAACAPHSERASRIHAQPHRGRTFLRNLVVLWL